ncbi:MAG: MazG nucleotide pyrophosphohydrolase domain-containing protein [bacterium]|nr:MazG nucleotide pyrophosphohydrolase domain-containing protein [bacterium]
MKEFDELLEVINRLFSPDGCPWDKQQTLQSMKKHILEEAQEVVEAIDEGDSDHLLEEIGDLAIHVISLSIMAKNDGLFSLADVLVIAKEKLLRRHPHVFSGLKVNSVEEVLENWKRIKEQEKDKKIDRSLQ